MPSGEKSIKKEENLTHAFGKKKKRKKGNSFLLALSVAQIAEETVFSRNWWQRVKMIFYSERERMQQEIIPLTFLSNHVDSQKMKKSVFYNAVSFINTRRIVRKRNMS